MKDAIDGLVTIATLIVGVAIVAVLVSKNSETSSVVNAGGSALANALKAAISPVTTGNAGVATALNQTGAIFDPYSLG